jgi:hypothetical protein
MAHPNTIAGDKAVCFQKTPFCLIKFHLQSNGIPVVPDNPEFKISNMGNLPFFITPL